jgi:antitoxin ParD1/3/4
MNIQLQPKQEEFIQKQLDTGKFDSPEQVIDAAFKVLENLQDDYWQWVDETRQKIDVAIQELDNGEGLDGETVINCRLFSDGQCNRRGEIISTF